MRSKMAIVVLLVLLVALAQVGAMSTKAAVNSCEMVTICHYDQNSVGPNAGPHEITINENAVAQHLANHTKNKGYVGDDSIGSCPTATSTPLPTSTFTPTKTFTPVSTATFTPTPTETREKRHTRTPIATATRQVTSTKTSTPIFVLKEPSETGFPPAVVLPTTGQGHENNKMPVVAGLITFTVGCLLLLGARKFQAIK